MDDEASMPVSWRSPILWIVAALAAIGLCAAVLSQLEAPAAMHRIRNVVDINRPMERVFAYSTAPRTWGRWNPATVGVNGAIDHSLATGEQVVQEILIAGLRTKVLWMVTESSAPTRWTIEGRSDPDGAARISYLLERNGSGTRFTREFLYRTPNALFALLDGAFLRPRFEEDSAVSVVKLKAALESE